jgi:hypothetical protein
LCSYATFEDHLLAKRCLYLFAGMPFNDEGLLAACAYEYPTPHFGGNSIGEPVQKRIRAPFLASIYETPAFTLVDYAMLFAVTLLDYVKATNDVECGKDLFETAWKQFPLMFKYLTPELSYQIPERSMSDGGEGWHFVDCECEGVLVGHVASEYPC